MLEVTARPEAGFTRFGLQSSLERGIAGLGFVEPRPIQAQTIEAALAGRDVLGLAQTGTGKTAAFALPILERLLTTKKPGPRALIVAPTRELAMQIHAEIVALAKFTPVKATTIFGGVGSVPQIRALRGRPDIIVACPGRLLDLAEQGHVVFSGIETLVLDEADHMFDLGFLPDVRRILAMLPAKRQNLLFSATMPNEIRSLADGLLRNPHVVELAHTKPLESIGHALYIISAERKVDLLRHLLENEEFRSALVFTRTKHRAKRLAQQLNRAGHGAVALEGNMSQAQRDKAMGGFRDGRFNVLVATDIAARGIDVAKISYVINFDVPGTPDAYTHRVGRTGRAGELGKAYTFASVTELADVHAIERRLKSKIPRLEPPVMAARAEVPEGELREHREPRTKDDDAPARRWQNSRPPSRGRRGSGSGNGGRSRRAN
jgi:ATP-dependent RNA helicase RhlE